MNSQKFTEITREMIEGCLDDDLNEIYGYFEVNHRTGQQVDGADIIKHLRPDLYEAYFNDYLVTNLICSFIENGQVKYFEPIYDEDENAITEEELLARMNKARKEKNA